MSIAICAIAKDELQYLSEWIAYYLMLGVDSIYIYDNESTDGSREYLERLATDGFVKVVSWTTRNGISPQLSAYRHFLREHSSNFEYVGFFDLDEFLVVQGDSIKNLTKNIDPDVGAVAINQLVFGSSGLELNSPEPVIERFTRCSDFDYGERRWFKSLVRPTMVKDFFSPHAVELSDGRYAHVDMSEVIQEGDTPGKSKKIVDHPAHLNHYMLKSKQEYFEKKQKRGGGAALSKEYRLKRFSDSYFFNRDMIANSQDFKFSKHLLTELKGKMEDLK